MKLTRLRLSVAAASIVAATAIVIVALRPHHNREVTTVAYGVVCQGRQQVGQQQTVSYPASHGHVDVYGPVPQSLCVHDLQRPASDLAACVRSGGFVVVIVRGGSPEPCEAQGLEPFSSADAAAERRVAALADQLKVIYDSRSCWQPQALADAATVALKDHQMGDWSATVITYQAEQFEGSCGTFATEPGYGSFPGTFAVQAGGDSAQGGVLGLDPRNHQVQIYAGASRAAVADLATLLDRLYTLKLTPEALIRFTQQQLQAHQATRYLHLSLMLQPADPSGAWTAPSARSVHVPVTVVDCEAVSPDNTFAVCANIPKTH